MTLPEFTPWPKIPRLNREVIVTEKVNGTNAAVVIPEPGDPSYPGVFAQSRKKVITPQGDNFGFARWVSENESDILGLLGFGTHFGEWYGPGIQKNELGVDSKRFMLFNTERWGHLRDDETAKSLGIEVASVIFRGEFDTTYINEVVVNNLREHGSRHVEGGKAEGVIIYHTASNQMFKVLCENDEGWKG